MLKNSALNHSARTTAAALASLLVARAFGLPESYWAVVSTMIVMQSSLDTSLPVAWRRLAGTALGAAVGALLGTCFRPGVCVFGAGLLSLGLICALLGRAWKQLQAKLDRTAYRYAGIAFTIIILIPRPSPAWIVACHRFFEVSIGIGVALAMTAVWPEAAPGGGGKSFVGTGRNAPNRHV